MTGGLINTADSSWIVHEHRFDPDRIPHFEGLFTLGSGLLHVRGSLEEKLPGYDPSYEYLRTPTNVTAEAHPRRISGWGVYLPLVTGRHPLLNEVVVNLPWPLELALSQGGERLTAQSAETYSRELDMRTGSLDRVTSWRLESGALLSAEYRSYVCRRRPNLIVQELSLELKAGEGNRTEALELRAGIDSRVRTNGHDHFSEIEHDAAEDPDAGGGWLSCAGSTDLGARFALCSRFKEHEPLPSPGESSETRIERGDRYLGLVRRLELAPGRRRRFVKLTAVTGWAAPGLGRSSSTYGYGSRPSARQADPAEEASRIASAAEEAGTEALWSEHTQDYSTLWETADIEVEAEGELQRAVRFSNYHLLRAHRAGSTEFAICPKGHAGEAYFGRYFWDTEIYLLPFYIHTAPGHARDLLRYRIGSLDGARANAQRYGYSGARYAWEASLSGEEECPNWQYADLEVHVTADVVFGLRHYHRASGDARFIYEEALPVIVETARYWADRLDVMPDGSLHIFGVMGPDEYAPFSDDNAFTNRLAAMNLAYAAEVLRGCRRGRPDLFAHYAEELTLTAEDADGFEALSKRLPIPTDAERGIILQSADFDRYPLLEELTAPSFSGNGGRADGIGRLGRGTFGRSVSQERLYRRRALKQADVVALVALFPQDFPRKMMEASFDYYERITTHDSSLSASTHAIVAGMLGRPTQAYDFYHASAWIDLDPTGGDASQGIHIANAGGNWQSLVYGFAGLRPAFCDEPGEEAPPSFTPTLPPQVRSLRFKLWWHGSLYEVYVTSEGAQVRPAYAEAPETRGGHR
jgi:kojibiose phosphorylase